MSAYMMDSDKLIAIASWAALADEGAPTVDSVAAKAEQLHRLNVQSLQARYPGDNDHGLRHDMVHYGEAELRARITDGLILSALDVSPAVLELVCRECRYQCCEFESWSTTLGARVIEDASYRAVGAMIDRLVDRSRGGWAQLELVDNGAVRLSSLLK